MFIDGDTIVVADQLVRLHGIDAPELDQTFWWRVQHMLCGTDVLAAPSRPSRPGSRSAARWSSGTGMVAKVFSPHGLTSAARLVSAGWALAYWRYSKDYVGAEDEARKAKRGMWRGSFVKPWVWRASQGTQAPSRVVPMSGPRR